MDNDAKIRLLYLFERLGEPLFYGPRGEGENLTFYNVPMSTCPELVDASRRIKENFTNIPKSIQVKSPTNIPDLSAVSRACPKSAVYNYFNPNHREATAALAKIFSEQRSVDDLLSMSSVCRDNDKVNPKVWLNAFASTLLNRQDTKTFHMPALWEVFPDEFFSTFAIKQASREFAKPEQDRNLIEINGESFTGRNTNPENRLAYFREDLAINSHHWHWHLVYPIDAPRGQRDRKGELFYYMHTAMLARYEAERLANGLNRTKALELDDPIDEGYFPKLTDTNSGTHWGTRQAGTKLQTINRLDDPESRIFGIITLDDMRKFKDRIYEAIDTGFVITPKGRQPLNIDILGDMVESSTLSPNPQFYGRWGYHNLGHILIAFSHDPKFDHREGPGVMNETTTAMRDPAFYRWHKSVDNIFDAFKLTLPPYQVTGGDFQLEWNGIEVTNINVQSHNGEEKRSNSLRTFWMRSDVDLSRGLDFFRSSVNNLGPVWARIRHLNHEEFSYTITVNNRTRKQAPATVRIFMAPRFNEHGERFTMSDQRRLFFEMDKFTVNLKAGENTITRQSTESNLTIPWAQTFRDLERSVVNPSAEQSVCGCGWPQHMLCPRGTVQGMVFDLVVFLTNGQDDRVNQPSRVNNRTNCRDAMSFCGILDARYPDTKPMNYPFDRAPYTSGDGITEVANLDEYVAPISNMRTIQVRVYHDPNRVEIRPGGAPSGIRQVSGDPLLAEQEDTKCGIIAPNAENSSSTGANNVDINVQPQIDPRLPPGKMEQETKSEPQQNNTWGNAKPWETFSNKTNHSSSGTRPNSGHQRNSWVQVSRPGPYGWGYQG